MEKNQTQKSRTGKEQRKAGRIARITVLAVLGAVLINASVYGAELSEIEAGQEQNQTEQEFRLSEASPEQNNSEVRKAGWSQEGDFWYYYDEAGRMQTGWIQAEDGLWYELDKEKGSWIRRPDLDTEAVIHLLENAIKKMGYYQNEEQPVIVREDGRSGNLISLSVRVITGPNGDQILNTYEVNKKSGRVKPAVGDSFNLYD